MAQYADDFTDIKTSLAELKTLAKEEKQRDRASWKREQRLQDLARRTGKSVEQILDELDARS